MENEKRLIGPFSQMLTMDGMPDRGAIKDREMPVLEQGGLVIENGMIQKVGKFEDLKGGFDGKITKLSPGKVVLPGFIDCHTHIAYAGSRAKDFALRNAGTSYLEIAAAGGGIWSTVEATRGASSERLVQGIKDRVALLSRQGITTIEVKSGYGLSVEQELRLLRSIKEAARELKVDLIATCLAAHSFPKDFAGGRDDYLQEIIDRLFPILKEEQLANRVDAFVEKTAFSAEEIQKYFAIAKEMGFDITVHADQFTVSGSEVALEFEAISADHLEVTDDLQISKLSKSQVIPVALPGASLGIGCDFTPARKLLDAGCSLAIATDWNPGSAPMGDLIAQASILATYEKLSTAEVLAAVTYRAAQALGLHDRGCLREGMLADFTVYYMSDYQEILYHQGQMRPDEVWKNGKRLV